MYFPTYVCKNIIIFNIYFLFVKNYNNYTYFINYVYYFEINKKNHGYYNLMVKK